MTAGSIWSLLENQAPAVKSVYCAILAHPVSLTSPARFISTQSNSRKPRARRGRRRYWKWQRRLVVTQLGAPPLTLRNEGGNQHNWIRVDLKALNDNKSAIGTKV